MGEAEKIINTKNAFIGVLSSNQHGEERVPKGDHIVSYFNNGGGMVYLCSKDKKDQNINYLKKIWNVDFSRFIKLGRLMFICREDFLLEDDIDVTGLLKAIEKGVGALEENGANKNQVYITLDSFWDTLDKESIEYLFDELKTINNSKKTGFILRYIIEEFNGDYVKFMLDNHDSILVDRIDDFEFFTPSQLVHQSLILLAEYHAIDYRYEKEVMRNEYLKTLGELMEGTIHDISNLLVTVLGYAQLSLFLEDSMEIKDYLQIISKTALDGKSITDRIKNHIKGRYESLKDIYEFDYIINNCIDMIKHKFKSSSGDTNNMELVIDLNSNNYIYANEYDIRHSVLNIILNGVEAMGNKGIMNIRTYDEGDYIVLEITDTGKGMDEGTKNKIFKPYFTTKGSNGTGLGLSIAKKTFEKHNGKVYVESKTGEGTKFTIYFPALRIEDNIAHL
ncbi:sensor histidine kinase [Schnuerera sp.]|uniref:sensor histidine kinase n=1 Tax=Schnuerera sp. TaxID=2794844 RepID=UPI002CD158B4|nr:ATP-binding protein [Schnuerera sp.]HSH34838.1 ATP-binding protein [Schnuerera sp.]